MKHVIEILGTATELLPKSFPRMFLASADLEAYGGQGTVQATSDPEQAQGFDTHAEAFAYWKSRSRKKPLRDDGQPNRPLTAFTVQVIPL